MGIEVADEGNLGEEATKEEVEEFFDGVDLEGVLRGAMLASRNPIVEMTGQTELTTYSRADPMRGEVEVANPDYRPLHDAGPGRVEVGEGQPQEKTLVLDGRKALIHILKTTILPLSEDMKDHEVAFSFGGQRHRFNVAFTEHPDGGMNDHVWQVITPQGDVFTSGLMSELPPAPKTKPFVD